MHGLVPRQGGTPALPQQPEPVVELRHGLLNAVSIGATGGELDRQGYAVELSAELADDRRIGVVQLETPSAGVYALDEKLNRGKIECLRRGKICIGGRATQRRQLMNMLSLDTQRLPAGRQDVNLWRSLEDTLGQRCHDFDDVLAAVEDQQHSLVAKCRDDAGSGIAGLNQQPEPGSDRGGDEKRIVDRPEIEKMHGAGKLRQQFVADGYRNGTLADSARSDDGHEALGPQLLRYLADGLAASHHPCQTRRQTGRRIEPRARRNCRSRFIRPDDRRDKAIASSRQRSHVPCVRLAARECLAESCDMHPQTDVIHRDVRPYARHQLILADDLACPFDQDNQKFQRPAAEVKRNSGPFESSSRCMQTKWPERNHLLSPRALAIDHRKRRSPHSPSTTGRDKQSANPRSLALGPSRSRAGNRATPEYPLDQAGCEPANG